MTIFDEIKAERERQGERWAAIDDGHTMNDWVALLVLYAGKAVNWKNTREQQRTFLLQVAALAVAALEAFDRHGGFPPRHYEETE